MDTTRLSTKGQVILPAAIRQANHWKAGLEFTVENTADGVLLRPLRKATPATLDQVVGCTGYKGKAYAIADMDAAINK